MIRNTSIAIILSFAISLSARNIHEQPRDCDAPVPILVNGTWGFIDHTGKIIIEPQFKGAGYFSEGLATVAVGKQGGYINRRGEWVIKPSSLNSSSFSEGFAPFRQNDKYGYIDKTGKIVIPLQFDRAQPFSEGLAAVYMRSKSKYGYIDKTGTMVIPLQFDHAEPFCGGLARVDMGHLIRDRLDGEHFEGKFGYINTKGEYIWKQTE